MHLEQLYNLYLQSTGVTTDTRNIQPGNIFFALKGDKFNANQFAEEALNKGAACVVVDEIANHQWKAQFGDKLILVDDVLHTLQALSGFHRQQLKCPVLAITGSNGKTTTKELVAAVLSKKYKTYYTQGNLNNHIGVPLTLLSINKDDAQFVVIEMGANHQGEIAGYCEYTRPGYGLITNVGLAHLEGFGGPEGVLKGKTELYRFLAANDGKVFVSADDAVLLEKAKPVKEYITYGKSETAWCAGSLTAGHEFLTVQVEGVTIQTNLLGNYNFGNAMSAVCIGKYFGVSLPDIKAAIETYVPSNNRSQKIMYGSNTIYMDAYNANPSSMTEALQNFNKADAANKVVIIGEMMELGEYSEAEHRKIKQLVDSIKAVKKVFVGKGFSFVQSNDSTHYFEKTDDVKLWFREQWFNNCHILIKGSRKNELEKILKD